MDAEKKVYCMNCFSEIDVLFDSTCAHCGWRDEGQVTNALPFGTVLCDRYLIGQAVRMFPLQKGGIFKWHSNLKT